MVYQPVLTVLRPEEAARVDPTDPGAEAPAEVGTPEGRRVIEALWNPHPSPAGRGPRPRHPGSRPRLAGADRGLDAVDLADLHRAFLAAGLQHGPAAGRAARARCG